MENTSEIEKLKLEIIRRAKLLGFDLIGFSPIKIQDKHTKTYKNWLLKRYEGEMFYMQKADTRLHPAGLLNNQHARRAQPYAKSVIVLAVNYYHQQKKLSPNCGRIARYAYGRDYHKIIKKKLKQLEDYIQEISLKSSSRASAIQTKSYVDTGPVLERALAEQAGIGFIGKNSCLITREFGSWVFLAEIFINKNLRSKFSSQEKVLRQQNTLSRPYARSDSEVPNQQVVFALAKTPFPLCGNCTKCIKSCPTKAIIAPGIIDARKCISYLTIENKKPNARSDSEVHNQQEVRPLGRTPFPKKFAKIIKQTKRIFGCDICQEVCPHNIARQKQTLHKEFMIPKIAGDQQNLKKILSIKTDQRFLNHFAGSPLMRAKRCGMQRNVNAMVNKQHF